MSLSVGWMRGERGTEKKTGTWKREWHRECERERESGRDEK